MTIRLLKYIDNKDEKIFKKLGTEELRYLERIKGSRKGGAAKKASPEKEKSEEPKPKKAGRK